MEAIEKQTTSIYEDDKYIYFRVDESAELLKIDKSIYDAEYRYPVSYYEPFLEKRVYYSYKIIGENSFRLNLFKDGKKFVYIKDNFNIKLNGVIIFEIDLYYNSNKYKKKYKNGVYMRETYNYSFKYLYYSRDDLYYGVPFNFEIVNGLKGLNCILRGIRTRIKKRYKENIIPIITPDGDINDWSEQGPIFKKQLLDIHKTISNNNMDLDRIEHNFNCELYQEAKLMTGCKLERDD